MAIFFFFSHISCTANFNMILFHLEIDFYFGMMVGVSGREKMGHSEQAGTSHDTAVLCKRRLCIHPVPRCVCEMASGPQINLLPLPSVNGKSLNNGWCFRGGKQMFSFLKPDAWQGNSSHAEFWKISGCESSALEWGSAGGALCVPDLRLWPRCSRPTRSRLSF